MAHQTRCKLDSWPPVHETQDTLRYFRIFVAVWRTRSSGAGHVTDDVGARVAHVNTGGVALAGDVDASKFGCITHRQLTTK